MDKNENVMPFAGKFDCDPADCTDAKSKLDYNVTEDSQSEQSVDNTFTTVDPSYGVDRKKFNTQSSKETNLDALYVSDDIEVENDGYMGGYEIETTSTDTSVDPSDEMAATCDCDFDPTTNAQKRCSLDDYEIISDVIGTEKQLVKLYSSALCESAEEPLRDVIRENLIECAKDQYETFEYMSSRGLYKTEQADEKNILEAKQQFCPIDCKSDCDCGCN